MTATLNSQKKDLLSVAFRRIPVKYASKGEVSRQLWKRQRAQRGESKVKDRRDVLRIKRSICQRVRARAKGKYARTLVLPRGRDGDRQREERSWNVAKLISGAYSSTRGCVIAGSLDLFRKYDQHIHSSKLLGTRQISSLGFKGLTWIMLTLLIAS